MARTVRRSGMKEVPLSEIKDDLSRFLREAETQEIVITRHGKPAGVLIGFESGPASRAQAVPRLFDATQETRVMFEAVLEPVFFRFKAYQHAGGLAVARDDDLLRL